MSRNSLMYTLFYCLFITILQAIRIFGEGFEKPIFIISNISFTIFIIIKIFSLRNEKYSLLNPLFLASLKMFLLSYGVTIFYIYIGNKPLFNFIKVQNPYRYLNNGIIYASIGFITMWYSYHSLIAKKIAVSFYNYLTIKKNVLRMELEPRWFFVYTIFFISIALKFLLISLGVYGVLGTIFVETDSKTYLNYVITISSASSGVLLLVYAYYFNTNRKRSLFIVFFIIDIFFSIISGFKGAIVMSVAVLAVAYYLVYQKVNFKYVIIIVFSIIFAYRIVEPYRHYIQTESRFEKTSINSIVKGVISSYKYKRAEIKPDNLKLIRRFNFLPELVKFQEYKTEHGLTSDDPNFLYLTLTSPIQIFVPRFLWKDKPKSDLGLSWVTQKVFGRKVNTSMAFGPLGFLYLTGGAVAIILGFFFVGLFLRLVNHFLISNYWGGIIVALSLFLNTISLEAQFNSYIVIFVQTLLMVLLFQYIILRKDSC